jgi:hypothetical protein
LLYHAIANLHHAPLAPETYQVMLQEIEQCAATSRAAWPACCRNMAARRRAGFDAARLPGTHRGDCPRCLEAGSIPTCWGYSDHEGDAC